ncbi:alpha/beta hydrolase [Streptomyces kanamyceticus]|uniref:Alpha/beta hydrolase n=1 Tax=Streptomyces kanamyceticus TaxID=1967 RepID=A0A5J6GG20_STRKN|nr:alpha/beta hydrolase [Streptomyces kanamyceticus]QEU93937.1 alpha/beta hydrolase [Streptomyces kanamyceticus]
MRRTLLTLVLCGTLLSASAAAGTAAPDPLSGRVFSYGSHTRQNITVYGHGGTPLVILHGGYWSKDTDWSGWARWFAARGFTVYDTDYRLTSDAVWPAQRDDVLAALRWVGRRENGARPLVLGSSAGGQLALQAGTYGSGLSRVRGVVALSPVASPYRAWLAGAERGASPERRELRGAAERLAGCVPDRAGARCWERWGDLAAVSHASGPDDAPLFLVHSTGDFVPVVHSVELATAQRRAGLRDVTVRTVGGSAHGAPLLKEPGMARDVLHWLRGRF